MEFVLHGLAAYSLISKKMVENETRFSDLLGTMMNFTMGNEEQEEDTF
jgi:magnesium chelatase subunit I